LSNQMTISPKVMCEGTMPRCWHMQTEVLRL
jgi:hypothetical protein